MKVVIVGFDGFTDLDLFLPWDLLNRVRASDWRVEIIADADTITSGAGLTIPTHDRIEAAVDADAVLITSGKGVDAKLGDDSFLAPLQQIGERTLIGAVDAGALVLGTLGLLRGRRATTYPTRQKSLEALGATVVEKPFVREGNIATAAGCLGCQDLAGWVIETLVSVEERDAVLGSIQRWGEGLKPL